MIDIQKFIQRHSRRIFAIGALTLSLLLFSLLMAAAPTGSGWMVIRPIAAGARIQSGDLSLVKVNLGSDSSHYFGAKDLVIGKFATHNLVAGDLLATSDLQQSSPEAGVSYLPIGILAQDIGSDISPGKSVDIYLIPKDSSAAPALVLSQISVATVDSRSRSLGGSVNISVSVTPTKAQLLVDAESQGRLVVASDAF